MTPLKFTLLYIPEKLYPVKSLVQGVTGLNADNTPLYTPFSAVMKPHKTKRQNYK